MTLTKADYDLINLGCCIKGQADRLGIEHDGVPLIGVVVRIANAADALEATPDTPDENTREALARYLLRGTNPDVWEWLWDERPDVRAEYLAKADDLMVAFPALSRAAVPEATEPEWEYGATHVHPEKPVSIGALDEVLRAQRFYDREITKHGHGDQSHLFRRTKAVPAGPWLLVPERGE